MITLNNIEQPTNMICLTDIPNILKVKEESGGTKTVLTLTFTNDFKSIVTYDHQFRIAINGDTITNVMNGADAFNKNFIAAASTTSTAANVARALRNCPNVFATFNIQQQGNNVILTSRKYGSVRATVSTNIPNIYMSYTTVDGTTYSDLDGKLIDVDIYQNTSNGEEYVTTLEKTFMNGEAAFDLSPVLTTFAENFTANAYNLRLSSFINGTYNQLGTLNNNYISIGYMCNQGERYIINGGIFFAQNVQRGASRDVYNNMPLYVYGNTIPMSFYAYQTGGMNITVEYLDSAYNVFTSSTQTWRNTDSSRPLKQYTVELNSRYMTNAFYIDVSLGNTKIRYNVIKPINMTEGYTRLKWINEYGGVSFADFTAERDDARTLTTETYRKNIFDYYENDMNELELSYDNRVEYTVTVNSHLIENDGKYIFNSLIQSPYIWTEINGEKYVILLDDVSVDETEQNNIYKARVRFHYSMEPSIDL